MRTDHQCCNDTARNAYNYRQRSSWLQSLAEHIKAIWFAVDGKARSSDLTEQSCCLVNAILTHVHVFLARTFQPTLHAPANTSKHHPTFYTPDALPVTQLTVSEHTPTKNINNKNDMSLV